MSATNEYNIAIWPGSSSFTTGSTAFGFFDSDSEFQTTADKVANFCARKLGYPLNDIELQDINFYNAFEEACIRYSSLINQANAIDNLLYVQGSSTSNDLTQRNVSQNLNKFIEIAKEYGNEAGSGGNINWYKGSIEVTAGQQTYDIYNLFTSASVGEDIEIKRVYHYAPPAITRYFDPFLDTGLGSQNMLDQFDFGGMSPAVTYLMMPMYHDLLRLQAIEFNDQIRKSGYGFEIYNQTITILPLPTKNFTLYFDYIKVSDRSNPLKGESSGTNKVADLSNIPYSLIQFSNINDTGRDWIFQYTLAGAMETLGWIRSKYSSVPIPNAEVTLNGPELLNNAQQLKEALLEKLKTDLEESGRTRAMEKAKDEAEYLQEQLGKIPLKVYIG